jgi:hypothetical protein
MLDVEDSVERDMCRLTSFRTPPEFSNKVSFQRSPLSDICDRDTMRSLQPYDRTMRSCNCNARDCRTDSMRSGKDVTICNV